MMNPYLWVYLVGATLVFVGSAMVGRKDGAGSALDFSVRLLTAVAWPVLPVYAMAVKLGIMVGTRR